MALEELKRGVTRQADRMVLIQSATNNNSSNQFMAGASSSNMVVDPPPPPPPPHLQAFQPPPPPVGQNPIGFDGNMVPPHHGFGGAPPGFY